MIRPFIACLTTWFSATAMQAALTISITPIDSTSFSFSASGNGSITSVGSDQGSLGFDANPSTALAPTFLGLSPGLTFGGNAVYGVNFNQFGYMVVFVSGGLPSSTVYSFAGGPVTGSVGDYSTFFNAGTHTINESISMFGGAATGVLTIAPLTVPEPGTSLMIAGFGFFFCWRHRRINTATPEAADR